MHRLKFNETSVIFRRVGCGDVHLPRIGPGTAVTSGIVT
jgi:hypothetical protein